MPDQQGLAYYATLKSLNVPAKLIFFRMKITGSSSHKIHVCGIGNILRGLKNTCEVSVIGERNIETRLLTGAFSIICFKLPANRRLLIFNLAISVLKSKT
ncbi:MAG: hypothetical protein HC782_03395 [Gammaproteobacteria bacterium]|nr:hypothetical protein [Gammaproteobacteria bacterium]